MRANYGKIGLPEELLREIDSVVENKLFGFRNRAEFAAEACRRLLTELKRLQEGFNSK